MDRFPIYLSLALSQREVAAVDKIQAALAGYQKDRLRFRTEKNLYCNSVEFRCYFSDPADVEDFAHASLNGFNLVRSPFLGGDERRCPVSLGREARLAVRCGNSTVKLLR